MAYAGTKVRIISRITDYDGNPITGSMGVTVTLDVFDPSKAKIVDAEAMTWSATGNTKGPYWFFDWQSPDTPGSYRSKVTATGGDDNIDAFEFGRFSLKRSPV